MGNSFQLKIAQQVQFNMQIPTDPPCLHTSKPISIQCENENEGIYIVPVDDDDKISIHRIPNKSKRIIVDELDKIRLEKNIATRNRFR